MKLEAIVAALEEHAATPRWWSLRATSKGRVEVLIQRRDDANHETIHTAHVRWTRASLRHLSGADVSREVAEAVAAVAQSLAPSVPKTRRALRLVKP